MNASKCEVAFFTSYSQEACWRPSLQLDRTTLNTTSLPKFLGVTIDRTLSFGPHVVAVISKASNRVLSSLTSKSWGWRKDQLLMVYRALHHSVINYAVPAWQPWLAQIRLDQPEHCHNKTFRFITGQLKPPLLRLSG